MPQKICQADPQQNEFLYTLASIVYRESLGYDEEGNAYGPLIPILASFGIRSEGNIPSVGIGQMRPNTAVELEQAGLVYEPRSNDGQWINLLPHPFEPSPPGYGYGELSDPVPPYQAQVGRLLDPVWAIEYVAANMEYARTRENYWGPPDPDPRNRLGKEWERMASYHNTGVVNINRVDPEIRDAFWQNILEPYVVGTYKARLAIQGLDLLGVKSTCDGTCGQTLTGSIVTPD